MKQKIGIIISGIIVVAVLVLGVDFFKLSPRSYLGDDASIIYANENITSKEFLEFQQFLSEININIDKDKMEEVTNEVDNFYILTYNSLLSNYRDYIAVVDLKKWYYTIFFDYSEYFDKVENYYVLKDKWINLLKERGINFENIYMVSHRGNMLLSTNKKLLFNHLNNSEVYSARIEDSLDKGKDSNLGIFVVNLKKDSVYNLKNLSFALNYKNGILKNSIFLDWSQKEEVLNVSSESRELAKYIKNNRIYIYNNDYYNLFIALSTALKLDGQYMFLINFFSLNSGVEISKLLEDINKEILYDISSKQGIIKLKNEENVVKLISSLENSFMEMKLPLKVENKKLYIGEPLEEKEESLQINLKNNQSFYFNYVDGEKNVKIQNFMTSNGIEIDMDMNKELLKNIIERMMKERGKNDKNL